MDARTARLVAYGIAGVVALFAFPAFLSTLFADSGPYDQLLEMSEPPTCTFRQSLGDTPPDDGDRIPSGTVAMIGVAFTGSIPGPPRFWNINSDFDHLPAGTTAVWQHYDARGYRSVDDGGAMRQVRLFARQSLEVPHGTTIHYATTTRYINQPESGATTQAVAQLATPPPPVYVNNIFNLGFWLPDTTLAVGLPGDTNTFTQASFDLAFAFVEWERPNGDRAFTPIAMRPGTITQLKNHMTANGIDPDRCDATRGSTAAVVTDDDTATDATSYYSSVLAIDTYGSTIAVSPFRGVIAAVISFLPLLLTASGVVVALRMF